MTRADTIYKICGTDEWADARASGIYVGSKADARDGFIHFSAAHQVRATAAKHFAGREDLLLIKIRAARLGEALKWEPSRGGDLFPHLYGHLNLDDVEAVTELPLADGDHQFPQLEV
jgi:uncharacterized protein (DUF952 family)